MGRPGDPARRRYRPQAHRRYRGARRSSALSLEGYMLVGTIRAAECAALLHARVSAAPGGQDLAIGQLLSELGPMFADSEISLA